MVAGASTVVPTLNSPPPVLCCTRYCSAPVTADHDTSRSLVLPAAGATVTAKAAPVAPLASAVARSASGSASVSTAVTRTV